MKTIKRTASAVSALASSEHARKSTKLVTVVLGAALAFGAGCVGEETTPDDTDEATDNDAALVSRPPPVANFQGFNSVLGGGLSTAVVGTVVNRGASSEVRCSVAQSSQELATALSISESLSIGFGPLGGGDEKASFMSSLKTSRFSVSVVVSARRVMGTRTVTNVRLKNGIAVPTTDAEADRFVRTYGDSYVSSLTLGGEFFGVYTFDSQTSEQQTAVTAELRANGIIHGATVGGDLQTKLSNFAKNTSVSSSFRTYMSGSTRLASPGENELITFAAQFPSKVLDAPVVISFRGTGYESVPGMRGFAKVAANRGYFGGNSLVSGLTSLLVKMTENRAQIDLLSDIYRFYGHYSDPKLTGARVQVDKDIQVIHNQMLAFGNNPTRAFTHLGATHFLSLITGSPRLSTSVGYSQPFGGSGGGPFQDVDINSYVQKKTAISAIKLRSGSRVDQLQVTYRDDVGTSTKTHGNNGGNEHAAVTLTPGTFITQISGRSGRLIDQLSFRMNNGQSYGFGGGGGGSFTFDIPANNFLMGFQGRSGTELDQIQALYFHFNPAEWIPGDTFSFSSSGPLPGLNCVLINEPSDPGTWSDNYLCSQKNHGIRWSFRGPIAGQRCTQINEASDPNGWNNNYICVPPSSPLRFRWSSAGAISGLTCTQWLERSDPHTWNDNYLCF